MRRLTTVLAAVVALALPAGAQAAMGVLEPADSFNHTAARTYWGGNPPCGNPTIYTTLPSGMLSTVAGYSELATCRIWVNRSAYTLWPAGRACMIVIHEWGHLRGLAHSTNPNDVMYYATDPWANIPYVRWPCAW